MTAVRSPRQLADQVREPVLRMRQRLDKKLWPPTSKQQDWMREDIPVILAALAELQERLEQTEEALRNARDFALSIVDKDFASLALGDIPSADEVLGILAALSSQEAGKEPR